MSKTLALRPRVSEKAYELSQEKNVYVFVVPMEANKLAVAQAVAAQFNVTVLEVNIVIAKGKTKRTVKRGGRQQSGSRSDVKKAYVTLKAGDSITIFAAEEEQEQKPSKKEKK